MYGPRSVKWQYPAIGWFLVSALVAGLPGPAPANDRGPPAEGEPSEGWQEEPVPRRPYGLGQIRFDARYLVRRPLTLERRGKRKVLAIAGATVALYLAREEIRDAVRDGRSAGRTRFLNDARSIFGKGYLAPALALTAWASSYATGNEREKETALLLLESMAYSSLVASTGSFGLAAERPEAGESISLFDAEGRGVSLDVALAASIIPTLQRQYLRVRPEDGPWRRFWKRSATGVLWAGALLTACQRMDADKHWAPDVFLGLVTGLSIGKTLNDAHDEARRSRGELSLGLVPGGAGFRLRWAASRPLFRAGATCCLRGR